MNIKLFHQQGCPMCKAVKMMLEKQHIDYQESEDIEEMKKLNITHTPALVVDNRIITGHDIIDWIKNR